MELAVLLLLISLNIVVLGCAFYARRTFNREKQSLFNIFRLYTVAPDKDTPSELFKLTDAMAGIFTARILGSLKASSMQEASVEARNKNSLERALLKDSVLQQNPLFSIALDQFPNLTKLLQKNPGALQAFQGLMAKSAPAVPSLADRNNGNGQSSIGGTEIG